jgi:hypothetical protein
VHGYISALEPALEAQCRRISRYVGEAGVAGAVNSAANGAAELRASQRRCYSAGPARAPRSEEETGLWVRQVCRLVTFVNGEAARVAARAGLRWIGLCTTRFPDGTDATAPGGSGDGGFGARRFGEHGL